MNKFRRVLWGLAIVLVVIISVFVIWAQSPLGPAPAALSALVSDPQVIVSEQEYIVFTPTGSDPTTGFIFYPGGRVEYRAYAVPLRQIAEQGYLVVLLPVRLNLAFFDVHAADGVIQGFPEIKRWVVGGHSLGGVAAGLYAAGHKNISGVVFWASYPANDSLRNSSIRVLSIYGTEDINDVNVFADRRILLPADTDYVVIEGGNHAQFGDYGTQPRDKEPTISRAEQQKEAVEATVKFLKELSP